MVGGRWPNWSGGNPDIGVGVVGVAVFSTFYVLIYDHITCLAIYISCKVGYWQMVASNKSFSLGQGGASKATVCTV